MVRLQAGDYNLGESKLKILFFIASLRSGGAERVACTLVNYWAEHGYEIDFVTLDTAANDFYKLHKNIKRFELDLYGASSGVIDKLSAIIKRIYLLRKIILSSKPDVVLSFMDNNNIYAITAAKLSYAKVVVSERTYPPFFNNGNLFDKFRKFVYRFANAHVAQTSEVKEWADKFLPKSVKSVVIANPLPEKYTDIELAKERDNIVLAVGRLSFEKGFDLLIKAYSSIAKKHSDWRLEIIGDGPDKDKLNDLIESLNMSDYIKLKGLSYDISKEYNNAKIFVLSSLVEGFPNVLLEAMAHGLAPISFDSKCGPRDIIQHLQNGILVESKNAAKLAEELDQLIVNHAMQNKLSKNALTIKNDYSLKSISNKWIDIFNTIVLK